MHRLQKYIEGRVCAIHATPPVLWLGNATEVSHPADVHEENGVKVFGTQPLQWYLEQLK